MKLRIRGDSIRMRVSQAELTRIATEGVVEDTIHFGPGNALVYRLLCAPDAVRPRAVFDDGTVSIELPAEAVQRWTGTAEVSIEGEQPLGEGQHLRILVEKDFACLAPREGEDESDMFAHPDAGRAC